MPVTARHDHTPYFTERLGANKGERVVIRLCTSLDVIQVRLKLLEYGEIAHKSTKEAKERWFEVKLPILSDRTRYAWNLTTRDDSLNLTMAGLHHTRKGYRSWYTYLAGHTSPEWIWSTVFYQIFPDRFCNGNDDLTVKTGEWIYNGRFVERIEWGSPITADGDIHGHYGGDLDGIRQKMSYLKELGVNGIWLNPIFKSPSNHRYDISDYRTVDPHLGENDIRVVLDGVFNHTGDECQLFVKAKESPESEERKMYTWKEKKEGELEYHAFFDVPTLPKIDYANEKTFDEFIDGKDSITRHWLRKGIDGWRLDVAHMIGANGTDEGNLEIHRRLRRAAKEEKKDSYVFGERFFDAEEALRGDGEDASMNYHGFGLPLMQWFARENGEFEPTKMEVGELMEILWESYHVLPPQIALSQYNLIDSHDVPRSLFRLKGNVDKLTSVLTVLFSFPGVPSLYYGTEIGLSQWRKGSMPWCRESMIWDEEKWNVGLQDRVKKLIRERKHQMSLQRGSLRFLLAEGDVLAFCREFNGVDGEYECSVCVTSRRGEEHKITLQMPIYGSLWSLKSVLECSWCSQNKYPDFRLFYENHWNRLWTYFKTCSGVALGQTQPQLETKAVQLYKDFLQLRTSEPTLHSAKCSEN
ncbi:Neopullulanase [Planoprotostelium fungivorum]|uniref:Neopullulanase n=1 Tax=Planoprotostelium fungivorum TaxID=1890364 RepID=A0A2P6NWC0_9EUKA|nr:Neopullulanase [Planoprotostelium fungivorum]